MELCEDFALRLVPNTNLNIQPPSLDGVLPDPKGCPDLLTTHRIASCQGRWSLSGVGCLGPWTCCFLPALKTFSKCSPEKTTSASANLVILNSTISVSKTHPQSEPIASPLRSHLASYYCWCGGKLPHTTGAMVPSLPPITGSS